jgi:predicted alpha/beta-hydrolase family hydrolase
MRPSDAWVLYVLAHGAGAGMRHPFLEAVSGALAARGVATLRYQFPYLEGGRRRPDPPTTLEATVQAAVNKVAEIAPDLPIIAGGKSMGGRMSSGAAASRLLDGIKGLAFLGFPLHAPGQPGTRRAEHLQQVEVPMLFLQGTRDEFARLDLITEVCRQLGPQATLHVIEGANHSFAVPKKSGRSPAQVIDDLADTISRWARLQVSKPVHA